MKRRMNLLAAFLVFALASQAELSLNVDQPAVCFQCHDEVEEQGHARHVHTAFEAGKCSDCHNPHAARHAALLNRELRQLCLDCHEELRAEFTLPVQHPPVSRGDCTSCHHPHSSDNPGQLHREASRLCGECHGQVFEWMESPVVHSPVEERDCLGCHRPHASGEERLLTVGVPALCVECHEVDEKFAELHEGRAIGGSNCTACHDPHAAERPGLLRARQHDPFAEGDCGACHLPESPTSSFALRADPATLCLGCHDEFGEEFEKAFHGHLSMKGSCVNCHNPHAADDRALLADEQSRLCMRCHFTEAVRGEKDHYLTHSGMDCDECHLPHGGDNPRLLRSLDIDLCLRCHEDAHSGSHPVGAEVIDARTGEAVTCLSCHQMHGAPFDFYLPLDPKMDLCIQCHKK